jgi:hypothetical protein
MFYVSNEYLVESMCFNYAVISTKGRNLLKIITVAFVLRKQLLKTAKALRR